MTRKGLLINFGLCCGSLILCLLVIEVVLGITQHNIYPDGYFRIDEQTGLLTATPGYNGTRESESGRITISTNSLGFRGAGFDPREGHRKRVVILGDSFVQAVQVNEDQTFGTLLSRSPAGVQVLQAGICGWGQGDQLRWLQENHQRLQPQLVIVAVYLGNDLTIDNMKRKHLGSTGYMVSTHGHLINRRGGIDNSPFSRFKQQTIYRSRALLYIGNLFYKAGHALRYRSERTSSAHDGQADGTPIYPHSWNALRLYRKGNWVPKSYLRVFYNLIGQIDHLGRESGFKVLVMSIPWERTMDEQRFQAEIDHHGLSRADFEIDLPRKHIAWQMEASGIPFLDLHEVFSSKPDPLLAYGMVDTHFSPTGHAWTAEALAGEVQHILD